MEQKIISSYEEAQDYTEIIADTLLNLLDSPHDIDTKITSAYESCANFGGFGGILFKDGGKDYFDEFAKEYFGFSN